MNVRQWKNVGLPSNRFQSTCFCFKMGLAPSFSPPVWHRYCRWRWDARGYATRCSRSDLHVHKTRRGNQLVSHHSGLCVNAVRRSAHNLFCWSRSSICVTNNFTLCAREEEKAARCNVPQQIAYRFFYRRSICGRRYLGASAFQLHVTPPPPPKKNPRAEAFPPRKVSVPQRPRLKDKQLLSRHKASVWSRAKQREIRSNPWILTLKTSC